MLLKDESYEIVGVYRDDDTLRSPTLEGFKLDLGRIFNKVLDEILTDVLVDMS